MSSIDQLSKLGEWSLVWNGRDIGECYEMRIINLHNLFCAK